MKRKRTAEYIQDASQLTDNASAVRFADRHAEDFRYVYNWKKWLARDGRRWSLRQGANRVGDRARIFAASIWSEASLHCDQHSPLAEDYVKFAKSANRADRIKAVIELATFDQRFATCHEDLDADPYLFNVMNGTLDLRNGVSFRDHQHEDLLTQVGNVMYLPGDDCPLWKETLGHVFAGDQSLIDYVQTLLGYSLTGITDEHCLPICYGSGNNGKSTIWNAFSELMGDYFALVSQDLLMPNKDQHPTEMADLFGKRFVAVAEPEQNRKLAESKVKDLTGDRIMKARRMREDNWDFIPKHTFWLSTNHKPKISGTDVGIWRRIKLIPFMVNLADVVQVDKAFPEKLKAEYSGILNWALQGWERYRSEGLIDPKAVIDATAEYRNSEDVIGEFLRETYIENPNFMIPASEAFKAFVDWGGKASKTSFGVEVSKRFTKRKHTAGPYRDKVVYEGIGLIQS